MEQMPDWEFEVIFESRFAWIDSQLLGRLKLNVFYMQGECLPRSLDPTLYDTVIFSTVQFRPGPLNLLIWAMHHKIPTIAIEEVNQCAWHNGLVNNYLAPVDHVFVASAFERDFLEGVGINADRLEVTGWPFFAGNTAVSEGERRGMKKHLDMESDRPLASLALPSLGVADESESLRLRQIKLAAEGLPAEFQLAIKPHPLEKMDVLRNLVDSHVPQATVVDGSVEINDLLVASDILLNRGVSQTAIEALLCGVPVLVLDAGKETPFHRDAPGAVARNCEDIARLSRQLLQSTSFDITYGHFFSRHIPFDPFEARKVACSKIADIASEQKPRDYSPQWLEMALFYGWQVDRRIAQTILRTYSPSKEGDALDRLLAARSSLTDIGLLLEQWSGNYHKQAVLSLWCDQLARKGTVLPQEGLDDINGFFSSTNLHLFCPYYERWGKYLIDHGYDQEYSWLMDKLAPFQDYSEWARHSVERLSSYKKGTWRRQHCRLKWLLQRAKEYGKVWRRYFHNPLPNVLA